MPQAPAAQTFGDFPAILPSSEEYLTLHFSPSAVPRKQRWSNYGLSADFLGDYFAAFFPGDEVPNSKINRRDNVRAAVSYIANELLENAVKYSDAVANLPISITLYLYKEQIIFEVINHANADTVNKYQSFIQPLLGADLDEFYTRQLEKAAIGMGESNMGLLTMMNDYGARFGWRFAQVGDDSAVVHVTVIVRLDV